MKKLYLLFLLLISIETFGQLSIGINTGFVSSKIDSKDNYLTYFQNQLDTLLYSEEFEQKSVNSINFGIVFDYKISSWFSLNTNLLFEQKGGEYFFDDIDVAYSQGDIDVESVFKFSYISLPICSRFQLEKGLFTIYLDLGINLLYGFRSVVEYNQISSIGQVKTDAYKLTYSENFKRFDLAVLTGIGFYLNNVGKGKIFINYRYSIDIVDNSSNSDVSEFYNNSGSINFGYIFPIGEK